MSKSKIYTYTKPQIISKTPILDQIYILQQSYRDNIYFMEYWTLDLRILSMFSPLVHFVLILYHVKLYIVQIVEHVPFTGDTPL